MKSDRTPDLLTAGDRTLLKRVSDLALLGKSKELVA